MTPDVAAEILSLVAERDDLARRIVQTAGWVRTADDEDGTPLYGCAADHDGVPLGTAVILLWARAGTVQRAARARAAGRGPENDEQVAGEGSDVSEPGGVHAATVAPTVPGGQVAP